MPKLHKLLVITSFCPGLLLAGPGLEQVEVRLPYGELKSLLAEATRPAEKAEPDPALLSARYKLCIIAEKPVLDATFRTTTFADGLAKIPLVGGNVMVESQKPSDARVLVQEQMLCQALDKAGSQVLELRLLPTFGTEGANLKIPACPATIFETSDLGDARSVALKIDGREQILGSNQLVALPMAGGNFEIRMLGGVETREALRPPEPSVWTWQHQALVIPGDNEISYRILARASASGGSGIFADLTLPPDARDVKVTGDDLAGHQIVRGEDRSLGLRIEWKSRGLLEREVSVFYQLPRRPLDRKWKLQAPSGQGDNSTRTRFVIVGTPEFSYAAEGLVGPFPPKGLPPRFAEDLQGAFIYQLENSSAAELNVNPLPVVATAEATVSEALWSVKLEPDGAMLVEGSMSLEHRGMIGVTLDVPAGLSLLSCDVGGQSVTPVNLGEGKIEINLPASGEKTRIACSFTGKAAVFDPVEGTLELSLPKTPLFIRALTWKIELPRNYQAETHGNLIRTVDPGDPPSRMTLRKNLCRDERPQTNVFYQRSDLKN